MQLHPSRFHSEEPLWVDCLAVLAVGDQKAYIPASSSTRPGGPTLAQVPWYVDSRLNGATRRRPTMPCRSTDRTRGPWVPAGWLSYRIQV